jgi:hypothetical protein
MMADIMATEPTEPTEKHGKTRKETMPALITYGYPSVAIEKY